MKKLIALLAAFALLLSLAACSAGDEAPETSQSTQQSEPQKTDPSEESTDHPPIATGPIPSDSSSAASPSDDTVGQVLLQDFQARRAADPSQDLEALANDLLTNPVIGFAPAVMPVEGAGLLMGFGNAEISGFSEGVQFGPMIGSIPFIGYLFVLPDGADVNAFMSTLEENADLRWNVCVTADEMIVDHVDNTVFFLMSPFE